VAVACGPVAALEVHTQRIITRIINYLCNAASTKIKYLLSRRECNIMCGMNEVKQRQSMEIMMIIIIR